MKILVKGGSMVIKKLVFSFVFNLFLLALTNAVQVTSNSDDGEGSLRQVISDSEEGDTITFSDSFTITLVSPITINKDIVIDGGDKVTISGGEETTIFKITSGNVEIKNITLRDGLSKGADGRRQGRWVEHAPGGGGAGMGGAIAIQSGNVVIDDVSFVNNKAIGGNGSNSSPTGNLDYAGGGGSSIFGGGARNQGGEEMMEELEVLEEEEQEGLNMVIAVNEMEMVERWFWWRRRRRRRRYLQL